MKQNIKHILTRVICGISIASIFWFLDTFVVHALQNIGPYSNLTIAESGQFYDNSSLTSYTAKGYKVDQTAFTYENTFYYALPTSDLTLSHNRYGGSLSQCGLSFLANNYYSMSFVFKSLDGAFVHPYYTQKSNNLGISNTISGNTSFGYTEVSNGIEKLAETYYGGTDGIYTVIFKAPVNGTCITTSFSSNPTSYLKNVPSNLMFLGYKYESMGASAPSSDDIKNALSGSFNEINNNINNQIGSVNSNIDNATNQINSNIDELKAKQDEQNETSKGIWGSLKDGIANIGKWFASLGESIGNFFSNLTSAIGNFFSELGSKIADGFSSIGDWFVDLKNSIVDSIMGEEYCHTETVTSNKVIIPTPFITEKDINILRDNSGVMFRGTDYIKIDHSYSMICLNSYEIMANGNSDLRQAFFNSNKQKIRDFGINGNKSSADENYVCYRIRDDLVYILVEFQDKYSSVTPKVRFYYGNDDSCMKDRIEQVTEEKQVCERKGGILGSLNDLGKSIGKLFSDLGNAIKDWFDKLFSMFEDSNVDGSTSDGQNFFENFETEDNGGISSLVTAPLVFVRRATESCSPLTLTAFDTEIELPCGDTLFWNKPEVASFRSVWNVVIGGSILFLILRKVFKIIENVKDPESDKVEVMKL